MKGSNKQFARYLDNEYNDFYLEAPDDDDYDYDDYEEKYKDIPSKNPKPTNQAKPQDNDKPKPQEPKKPVPKKSRQPEFKANFTLDRKPLTNTQIKKFVNLLGQDAKNCYYNLKEVQLPDPGSMDAFKPLYTKFETVPVLFLSVVPGQAVYLWQINRLCPYEKATDHMVLDSRAMNAETKLHISMLLLAKIGQFQGEELVDAKFAGHGKLIVKSRKGKGKGEIVIRLYKAKSFFQTARVNPFKQEVLANDEYSFKLETTISQAVMQPGEPPQSSICATLWKRKSTEEITAAKLANYNNANAEDAPPVETEILLEIKTLNSLPRGLFFEDSAFSEVFITGGELITLIDTNTSTVITWRDTFVSLTIFEIGSILSAHLAGNLIYLVTADEYKVHEVDLSQLPELRITDRTEEVNLSPYFLQGFPQFELQKIVQKSSLPYTFVANQNTCEVFALGNQRIYSTILGDKYESRTTIEVAQIEKELEKTKTFSWGVIGGYTHRHASTLLYLHDHYLNFVAPSAPCSVSSIELPFQENDKSKVWQIFGVTGRAILCGSFLSKLENTVMEVRYDAYSGTYSNSQATILNEEGEKYESFAEERLFCQVIGPNDNVTFIRFDNQPFYLDSMNLMYDVPISLINPFGGKKEKGNTGINKQDDEEKKEEERIEKMNKIKTQVKHMKGQSGLEENKAKLKEVRDEIGSKIKDIKKFDDEFKKHQAESNNPNNKKKEDIKVMKAPKGVSKDSLEVYDEIKTEKKKIEKEREKDKTQRKKDRNWKNDM